MKAPHYRNFAVRVSRISKKTGRYRVKITGLVPGGMPGYNEHESRIYSPGIFNIGDGGKRVNLLDLMRARKITSEQLYRLGTILSDVLLPGSLRSRFWESLRVVRASNGGLRLRLMIEAPELALLPWEYLYLAPGGEYEALFFLALQRDISIVRHEVIDEAEPLLEQRKRYRMIVASASPKDQDPLKIEEDRKAIAQMIAGQEIGAVEPVWVDSATRKLLREKLRQPADVFHFAGHGYFDNKKGQIILEKGDGQRSDFYNATLLANLLRGARIKLAVLNACETAARSDENTWCGVASALVRAGTAAVVASQYRLQDRNAIPLAEELYRSVLSGDTIDEAVYQARNAIHQQSGLENRDWGAPVLYLRVEDGVIFRRAGGQEDSLVPRIAPTPLHTGLIGRADDLAQTRAALTKRSKCYFYGAYGVGKTSLAVESFSQVVKEMPLADGYLWGRVSDMNAEQVLEWIGSQFPEQRVARAKGREAKVNALRDTLSSRDNFLIGLDDVSDATVTTAILEASGNCAVILNGGRNFNTAGLAKEIQLNPLNPDQAEELFLAFSNRPASSLQLDERNLIRLICAKLKCLPLFVKLAALKYAEGGESLATLWERVQQAPESLIENAVLEALYDNLRKCPEALHLLVRIASFPALEAPLAPLRSGMQNEGFFEAKDKLIALGLVEPAGADRLSLHPVLGIGVQKAKPEAIKTERQNTIRWLQDFAHDHRHDYPALDRERANLLGLCDWLEKARGWNELLFAMRSLFHYLRVRGYWQEAFQRLGKILTVDAELESDFLRAWTYLHRGVMFVLRSEYDKARKDFAKADELFTKSGDTSARGRVLYRLAGLSLIEGNPTRATEQLDEALKLMGEREHRHDRAGAHERVASILATGGKLAEARIHYEQALELGDREEQARVLMALGDLARRAGHYDEAQKHFERAAELVKQLGHVLYQASIEQELGYFNFNQERHEKALRCFEAAQSLYEQLGYQPGLAQALHALGNISLASNKLDEAAEYYAKALDLNQKLHHTANAAYNNYQLGVVAHRREQWDEARKKYGEVLDAAKGIEDVALNAAVHLQLSSLELAHGDRALAHSLADDALKLAQQVRDQLTIASALYNLGWWHAQQGNTNDALENLTSAHEKLVALRSAEAMKVEQAIKKTSGGGQGGGGWGGGGGIDRVLRGGGIASIRPFYKAI
jgi:tetratricopeptide (TPR) repeat protein